METFRLIITAAIVMLNLAGAIAAALLYWAKGDATDAIAIITAMTTAILLLTH